MNCELHPRLVTSARHFEIMISMILDPEYSADARRGLIVAAINLGYVTGTLDGVREAGGEIIKSIAAKVPA